MRIQVRSGSTPLVLSAALISFAASTSFSFDFGMRVFPSGYTVSSMSYAGNMVCGTSSSGQFLATQSSTSFVSFSALYAPIMHGGRYTALNDDGSVKAGHGAAGATGLDQAIIDRGGGNTEVFGTISQELINEPASLSGDGSVALINQINFFRGGSGIQLHYANGTTVNPVFNPAQVGSLRGSDLSRDGTTVVGRGFRPSGTSVAFRWSVSSGVVLWYWVSLNSPDSSGTSRESSSRYQ